MRNPLVSIIIINWNGADVLEGCFDTLLKQQYKEIEILVVDNNSSDDSLQIIRKYKKIKLIESKKNLGFAGGNNLGLAKAKGKYVLLLNTDTLVTRNFLGKLVSILEDNPQTGVVQPKILYTDNTLHKNNVINSIGAYLTSTGFLYYPGYGKKDTLRQYNQKKEIFTAYGACMLIRKDMVETIGLFDQDYFMYFEESDFCMRVWLSGWKVLYTPEAVIYHKGGISSQKFGMAPLYFHSFKNRICTYIKNFNKLSLFKILPVHIVICVGISLIYLLTGKFSFFLAVQKAFFWNMGNLSKTLKKRKIIQKRFRKVTDQEYFPGVLRSPRFIYYLYLLKGLQYYRD